jgi:hypothetical protein
VHGEPGTDDPTDILRVLPGEYQQQFRAEYAAAVEQARDPAGYRDLAGLLRLWRLRAAAYSDPGYQRRLDAAHAGEVGTDVPAEQVIAGWPHQ